MSGYWPTQDHAGTRIAPPIVRAPPTGLAENFDASRRDQVYNNNGSSEFILHGEAYAARIREIEQATGKKLDNPITAIPLLPGDEIMPGLMQATRQKGIDEFEAAVDKLRETYPDLISRQEMLERINTRSQEIEQTAGDVYEESTFLGTAGSFGGAMVGSLQDPLVGSSIIFGAKKGLGILKTALYEALIAGGVETAVQPNIQSGRADRGQDAGLTQGAVNVLMASGGAGVLGGLIAGGEKLFGREALKAFDEHVQNPTAEQLSARNLYERTLEINETSPLQDALPAALPEHGNRLRAAMLSLEEDGRAPDLPELLSPLDHRKIMRDRQNLDGIIFSFDPEEIEVDAKTFQFKSGGDAFGVTDRLKGVETWDDTKGQDIIVYEYADGRLFIADGHQRVGLAKRLQARGEKIKLYGQIFREADGMSPADARVAAAMKNIAEGSGTAVDAAKVLRVHPERIAELPRTSQLVRQAQDMIDLSDEAFGMIVNDRVPANYGALVGRLVKDENLQLAILDVLAKTEPSNIVQAESIVRQAMAAGTRTEVQSGLFGEEMLTTSLFSERAKVLDKALKRLGQDRKVFDTLVRNQDDIAAEGNVLARDANEARGDTAARAVQMIQTLANRKGVLSDALTAAARRAADEKRFTGAVDDFIGDVRRAIERNDFSGLETGGGERLAQIADEAGEVSGPESLTDESLALFDDPAGSGTADQTAALESTIKSEFSDLSEDDLIPDGIVRDGATGEEMSVTRSVKEILDDLEQDAADLDAIGKCGLP